MAPESQDFVIMACSAPKRHVASQAIDLYQGVMYSTYRANVRDNARPHVAILSAQHGVIAGDTVIEPYDKRLTPAVADGMVADLAEYLRISKPFGAKNVLLAGGKDYRRVMRAAIPLLIARGCIDVDAKVTETSGGIGYQRQQLGQFLRGCQPALEVVGHHPNGTPLYQALEGFTVWEEVNAVYRGAPHRGPEPAVIDELFFGPSGPTACVRMLNAKKPDCSSRWVALADLQHVALPQATAPGSDASV